MLYRTLPPSSNLVYQKFSFKHGIYFFNLQFCYKLMISILRFLRMLWVDQDIMQRICTAAEIRFYFDGFFSSDSSSKKTNYLKPNKNCNLTSWVNGCEPGWACSAGETKVDLKNAKNVPTRSTACAPCCEGFFCPHGLTCMIRKYFGNSSK